VRIWWVHPARKERERDTREIFIPQQEGHQGDIHSSVRGTPGRYVFPS